MLIGQSLIQINQKASVCILLGCFGLRLPPVQLNAACLSHQRAFRLISGDYTYAYAVFSLLLIRNNHHRSLNLSHPAFHGLKLHPLYFGRPQGCTEASHSLASGGRPCKDWVHLYHTPFNHTASLSQPGHPNRQVPALGGPMSPSQTAGTSQDLASPLKYYRDLDLEGDP